MIILLLCAGIFLLPMIYTSYDRVTSRYTLFKDHHHHHIDDPTATSTTITNTTSTSSNITDPNIKRLRLRPKILVWAKPYHKIGYTLPDQQGYGGGCDYTWNRDDYDSSDAVLFFMKTCNSKDLPNSAKRTPHRVHVWWSHESPWTVLHYYNHDLKDFNNYFNWTMTHRNDSDVLASYAPTPTMDYILHKLGRDSEMRDKNLMNYPSMSEERFQEELDWLMSQKSKFISWAVSDCHEVDGARKRMGIVNSMTKDGLLKIDKLGKCAGNPIPMNLTILLQTLQPYKFYLAFENSIHCRDYITEKSHYNGLVGGTVPVIYGPTKEDSAKVLPVGSFIHIDDFENINALSDYLKYLDKNNTAYREYFRWWKEPGTHVIPRLNFNYGSNFASRDNTNWLNTWNLAIQDDMMEIERFGLHHLCRKLLNNEHMTTSKTIPDMNKFWFATESNECVGR